MAAEQAVAHRHTSNVAHLRNRQLVLALESGALVTTRTARMIGLNVIV
jgi:hypothetical protein